MTSNSSVLLACSEAFPEAKTIGELRSAVHVKLDAWFEYLATARLPVAQLTRDAAQVMISYSQAIEAAREFVAWFNTVPVAITLLKEDEKYDREEREYFLDLERRGE